MMAAEVVAAMGGAMRVMVRGEADDWDDYHPDVEMEVPAWLQAA